MPSAGFEPTISTGERPQTYALDRAASETGSVLPLLGPNKKKPIFVKFGWYSTEKEFGNR